MLFYKFTKAPGIQRIPGYDLSKGVDVIEYLSEDSVISDMDAIEIDGNTYVVSIKNGLQYPLNINGKTTLTRTICVDAIVNNLCKSGISVFDSVNATTRKELCRVKKNGHVVMTMKFITDQSDNIWASVSVLNEDFSYQVESGYLIYKNNRNNFTNLYIPGAKYPTIVTNGVLDNDKIDAVKKQENSGIQIMSDDNIGEDACGCYTDVTTKEQRQRAKLLKKSSSTSKKNLTYTQKIAIQHPDVIQNGKNYPKVDRIKKGIYRYDYSTDYSSIPQIKDMSALYKHENLDVRSISALFKHNIKYYNRFKLANPDETLSRGFVHIFFTRPDCNLLEEGHSNRLNPKIANDPYLSFLFKKKPDLVRELTIDNGKDHDFGMFLSNQARSFSLIDDGAEAGKYGKSLGGYEISFIRRKNSETGSTFSIDYVDTRDLDIIMLHKLWMEYAINVYRGKWNPKMKYIWGKILDYACSVFVIVTAEDFETVLYWTKYYGVFPIMVPYSALSWKSGEPLTKPELSITYNYSWKEDFNPLGLTDLNTNAFRTVSPKSWSYALPYVSELGRSGYTWVGPPFVETVKYGNGKVDPTNGSEVTQKLRFKLG